MKRKIAIWDFFASVKLAIWTLCLLALTSIAGTLIPQKKSLQWYVLEYGENLAQVISLLDIADMYSSWWFLAMLGLLSANLIICSFDRFPGVWKTIQADGLAVSLTRLEKIGRKKKWQSNVSIQNTIVELVEKLRSSGWKSNHRDTDGGTLVFAQKGAYSRTGVYMVHASILVIFVGAIIGEFYGFKGSVMIPETQQTNKIYAFQSNKPINLGFTVRCDSFAIEFYDTGMAKDYRSKLTVLENGKELYQTDIEVNFPLTYKGITFYQSSYEGYNNFIIKLTSMSSGESKSYTVSYQEKGRWQEEDLSFGVINADIKGQSVSRMKIWLADSKGVPFTVWLKDGESTTVETGDGKYLLTAKQMYATGLQVSKDPGVWVVYAGCGLMLVGLMIAFFLSHRRIWLFIKEEERGISVLLVGSSNKNRLGFETVFSELAERLQS